MEEKFRIDKYLWAIRFFKTRSQAAEACQAGKVKVNGQSIKAAHQVKVGDIYQIQKEQEKKILKVLQLLARRVDAKTAQTFYEDLTVLPIDPNSHTVFTVPVLLRERGTGRPTKRERREIDGLQESWED